MKKKIVLYNGIRTPSHTFLKIKKLIDFTHDYDLYTIKFNRNPIKNSVLIRDSPRSSTAIPPESIK